MEYDSFPPPDGRLGLSCSYTPLAQSAKSTSAPVSAPKACLTTGYLLPLELLMARALLGTESILNLKKKVN